MSGRGSPSGDSQATIIKVREVEAEIQFIRPVFVGQMSAEVDDGALDQDARSLRFGRSLLAFEPAGEAELRKQITVAIEITDLDVVLGRAKECGARLVEGPTRGHEGGSEAAIEDPQGIIWRLRQLRTQMPTKDVERRLAAQRRSRM